MKDKIETNVIKPETKFSLNDVEYLLIDSLTENTLDSGIKGIEDFISSNDGKGISDEQKDNLYKGGQQLWASYTSSLRDAKYNFYLNRIQYKFLTNLLLTKLELDVNTVFFAIELTDMLASMKDVKYINDVDIVPFAVNTTEITYIYHLISKHKVNGLCKDAYTFAQILRRIGEISKIFNYYDAANKRLAAEIQDWVATFTDLVEPVVEGEVLSPKKKKKEKIDEN